MFIKKTAKKTQLDDAIDELFSQLRSYDPTDESYSTCVEQLSKLLELKQKETPERVSKDTLALVLGNLVGIAVIVGHERAHVVTSKALSFIRPIK